MNLKQTHKTDSKLPDGEEVVVVVSGHGSHSVVVVEKLVVDSGADVVVIEGQVGQIGHSVVVEEEVVVVSGVGVVVVGGQTHWLVVVPVTV